MIALHESEITCPFCGELISVLIDLSAGDRQDYIEDCQVCCRPIDISVDLSRGGVPLISAEYDASG